MDRFLLDTGFFRYHYDTNLYTKEVGNHLIILVPYVDDLIITGSDPKILTHVKSNLNKKFEMIFLGHLDYFLGLQVLQTKEGIIISWYKYSCDLRHCFHMEYYKIVPSTFQSRVNLLPPTLHPK